MTSCDEGKTDRHSILSRLVTVLLFLLAHLVVLLLVGSVALAVSFDPVWSAATRPAVRSNQATPGLERHVADATMIGLVPEFDCIINSSLGVFEPWRVCHRSDPVRCF